MSTTVRVSDRTHSILCSIAKERNKTIQATLEDAVAAYENAVFWKRANAAYNSLRKDPEAWKEELEERSVLDAALNDGLTEE